MAQVINTNSLSLITQNNINKNQSALSTSIERLSSGLRINSAKDDAAGQAIANRFTSNINGLTQAARNANDGISLAQTTEGALSEINNNLQRIRELTVQASNGTNSDSDLSSIQDEITSRLDEIDRVSGQTQFNGVNVLAKDGSMKIQVGANDGQTISIDLKQITASTLGLNNFDATKIATTVDNGTKVSPQVAVADDFSNVTDSAGGSATVDGVYEDESGNYFVKDDADNYYAATADAESGEVTFDSTNKASISGTPTQVTAVNDYSTTVKVDTLKVTDNAGDAVTGGLTDTQSLVSYKDDNGNNAYAVYDSSAKTYTAATVGDDGSITLGDDITTTTDVTLNPLDKLDAAIASVDEFRSSLGAIQNRFDSAITNLNNTTTNLSEAQSRIQDADYAVEVSNMSKAQIVQQAGNSVLAKANSVPQQVLSLLQG